MEQYIVKYEVAFDVAAETQGLAMREADRRLKAALADISGGRYAKRLGYYEGDVMTTFYPEDRDALSLD